MPQQTWLEVAKPERGRNQIWVWVKLGAPIDPQFFVMLGIQTIHAGGSTILTYPHMNVTYILEMYMHVKDAS